LNYRPWKAGRFEFFTDRTLIPLWGAIDDQVQFDLLPEFGGKPSQVVEFDLDKVQVLAQRKAEARKWALDALTRAGITRNEFRSVAGLPQDANGDVYLQSLATVVEPFVAARGGQKAEGGRRKAEGGRQEAESGGQNTEIALEVKAKNKRKAQEAVIAAQRSARRLVAGRMESALGNYFGGLADRVIHRTRKDVNGFVEAESKKLPKASDLLNADDEEELEELIKRFYIELIQVSWGYWDVALGVETVLDISDPLVTEILAGAGTRVRQIQETTLEELRSLLQHGNDNGWSIDHLVRGDPENGIPGLRDLIEQTYKNRARTIARTELGTAQNAAAAERFAAAGVKEVFVMDNGLDDDDEPCQAVNGTVQTLKWAREHPLEHPNCVIGETQVLAPNLLTGFARKFEGEVVVLRTAADHLLTCTSQHPILTSRGWVAAGELREGDQVVSCLDAQGIARRLDPDHNHVPTRIEHLFGALLKSSGVTASIVPGSAKDFHGDGLEGEVCIVDVNGFLHSGRDSQVNQQPLQSALVSRNECAGVCLTGQGTVDKFTVGAATAADSSLGGGGVCEPLLRGAAAGGEGLGRAPIQYLEAAPVERFAQAGVADADFCGQRHDALAGKVAVMERVVVSGATHGKAALVESGLQLATGQADFLSEIGEGLTGLVTLVELVEVKRKFFAGHVYNLETAQGWFVADGIITHNCTRAFAPEF